MSIARITTMVFKSQAAADAAAKSYEAIEVDDYHSAEQLIGIQSNGNKLIGVTLFDSQEAMDRSDAVRDERMANTDIVSIEGVVGKVRLNHLNWLMLG